MLLKTDSLLLRRRFLVFLFFWSVNIVTSNALPESSACGFVNTRNCVIHIKNASQLSCAKKVDLKLLKRLRNKRRVEAAREKNPLGMSNRRKTRLQHKMKFHELLLELSGRCFSRLSAEDQDDIRRSDLRAAKLNPTGDDYEAQLDVAEAMKRELENRLGVNKMEV
eukprot:GHVU01140193.1.p2 GENE.GHVU01140193.1~~GHVU01140193.1.p2  ORF type:complete len:166 (+),score=20.90 GHVU01140193.1:99-596(+)